MVMAQPYKKPPQENASSIFLMIRSAHRTEAAINLSVSGLPLGVPNRSPAVLIASP
jgi:hypothetical protein